MHHSEVQRTWNLLFDEGIGFSVFELFNFLWAWVKTPLSEFLEERSYLLLPL